ncbi:hypothetical protein ACJMK2_036212 [Sinanodonta woodiana]|uniref:Protein ARV n=1 Tax=Sinanodonta woodiana TaxID=1069815 RepID=A0ABD3WGI4_SINWO
MVEGKNENSKQCNFVCVNCGCDAKRLYQEYNKSVIRIEHCDYCGQVVDKYVEFDPVIIFLDALLLKKQALRHILLNSGIQSCWKFTLVLLICETFTKLLQKSHVPSSGLSTNKVDWQEPDHVIYSAMEWDLYKYFILSLIELGSFLFGMTVWLLLWKCFFRKDADLPSASVLLQGLVLSSFGQVCMLPMMIWGLQEHINVCHILCRIFTFSANVQTARVLCPVWSFGVSLVSVLFGYTLSQMTIQQLSQWLNFKDIT